MFKQISSNLVEFSERRGLNQRERFEMLGKLYIGEREREKLLDVYEMAARDGNVTVQPSPAPACKL